MYIQLHNLLYNLYKVATNFWYIGTHILSVESQELIFVRGAKGKADRWADRSAEGPIRGRGADSEAEGPIGGPRGR